MNGTCSECGRSGVNIVMPHVDYENDITIPLCRSCHGKLHCELSRNGTPLSPLITGMALSVTTRDRIKEFGNMGESYDDVLNKPMDACEPAAEFRQKSEAI